MPDESTNPVGTAQTPQDNQAVTNQTGDDFVLDFGEGEIGTQTEISPVETDSLETEQVESEESSDFVDIDFDSGDLFGDEKDTNNEKQQENDVEIEDESAKEDVKDDDFDISLDDNSESVSQDMDDKAEATEQEVSFDLDENPKNKNEEVIDENDDNLEVETTENGPLDNVEDLDVDSQSIGDGQDEVVDDQEVENESEDLDASLDETQQQDVPEMDLENQELESENLLDENLKESDEKNDISDLRSEENINVSDNILDNVSEVSDFSDVGENNEVNGVDGENNVDENLNIDDIMSDSEEKTLDNIDKKIEYGDNVEGKDEIFDNDSTNIDSEVAGHGDENNVEGMEKEAKSEDDGGNEIIDKDLADDMKQDESQNNRDVESLQGDSEFEGGEKQDVEVDGEEDKIGKEENTFDMENNVKMEEKADESLGSHDDVEKVDDAEISGSNKDSDNNEPENQGNIGMSFDSQFDGHDKSSEYENVNEFVDDLMANAVPLNQNNLEKDNQSNDVNDTVSVQDEGIKDEFTFDDKGLDEKKQQSESIEVKSTLSLDEIMDSELQSGKFSDDNQKSLQKVSTETHVNDGKGKRILVVMAGLGIFLMVGAVAYLAFPNLLNTGSGTGTGDDVQGDQHSVAQEIEEFTRDDIDGGEVDDRERGLAYDPDDTYESQENPSPWDDSKVGLEFPDVTGGDDGEIEDSREISRDSEVESLGGDDSPIPNDWYDIESSDSDDEDQDLEYSLTIEEINNTITSYREQGDWYYSYAQENSDNRIYKYAMKILSLCDEYEERVSKGEGMDEESYNAFKKETSAIITKLGDYINKSEVQTIETGNMPDDYDEAKQAELRDMVTKRANGELY